MESNDWLRRDTWFFIAGAWAGVLGASYHAMPLWASVLLFIGGCGITHWARHAPRGGPTDG